MKNTIIVFVAALAIVGCKDNSRVNEPAGAQKDAIKDSEKAQKDSLDQTKKEIQKSASETKKQISDSARAEKERVEAQADAAKASIEAQQKKIEADAKAAKADVEAQAKASKARQMLKAKLMNRPELKLALRRAPVPLPPLKTRVTRMLIARSSNKFANPFLAPQLNRNPLQRLAPSPLFPTMGLSH